MSCWSLSCRGSRTQRAREGSGQGERHAKGCQLMAPRSMTCGSFAKIVSLALWSQRSDAARQRSPVTNPARLADGRTNACIAHVESSLQDWSTRSPKTRACRRSETETARRPEYSSPTAKTFRSGKRHRDVVVRLLRFRVMQLDSTPAHAEVGPLLKAPKNRACLLRMTPLGGLHWR